MMGPSEVFTAIAGTDFGNGVRKIQIWPPKEKMGLAWRTSL